MPLRPRRLPTRLPARAVGSVALLTLATSLLSPTGTASAAPIRPPVGAVPHATFSANVTLVTGDTVAYREAGGRTTATLMRGATSRSTLFYSYQRTGDLYLVPMDALPYVQSGTVDQALFDITLLAHGGYGDKATATVPVIVSYDAKAAPATITAKARALPSASLRHTLESVHAAGVAVTKSAARRFWQSATGEAAGGQPAVAGRRAVLAGGVTRLALDRKVAVTLNESVPFIGAPEAWKAGFDGTGVKVAVLDTGLDDTHPDFAGHIAAERNFTSDPDTTDGFGHGTHVASTIVGSGAASGGKFKGVAPGAQLLIGKVLDHTGSGFDSGIIDGMEWATQQGARVVSMSLSSQAPSDGTDELSQAVDRLTASTGTLFVIAAGNAGPGPGTVGAPGSAASALTVGAVTKTGVLAGFSSRGPLTLNDALKPEITAPGVSITAARAAGTALGPVVDEFYTTISGTSMATPHVAGAAAILAQEHPDWTAPQLKAVLMASAKDYGYSAFEQGAGRVDVAREIHQDVIAEPAKVSVGDLEVLPGAAPFTQEITFRSLGGPERSYQLALTGAGADTAGKLSQQAVTVPAGGTATVQLTIDPTAISFGPQSWRIEATNAAGDQVVVPVGFVGQPRRHAVTIRFVHVPGGSTSAIAGGTLRVDNTEQDFATAFVALQTADPSVLEATLRLPDGVHDISAPFFVNLANGRKEAGFLDQPEVAVRADTVVTFDLAKTVPIHVSAPVTTEEATTNIEATRTTQAGWTSSSFMGSSDSQPFDWVALPTSPVTIGAFKYSHDHVLTTPQVTVRLDGHGETGLRPLYPLAETLPWLPKFTSDRVLGVATQADLDAGRNVRGRLVYLDGLSVLDLQAEVPRAAAAGAAGVLVSTDLFPDYFGIQQLAVTIPVLWIDLDHAGAVRRQLAGGHRVTATVHAQLESPFEYKLRYYELGQVAANQTYQVRQRDLATVDTSYHAESVRADNSDADEVDHAFRPEDAFSSMSAHSFDLATRRVEYYQPTGADVMWWRQYAFLSADQGRFSDSVRRFTRPTRETESWNNPIVLAGQKRMGPQASSDVPIGFSVLCAFCLQGDHLVVTPALTADGDPSHDVGGPENFTAQLFQGDQEIAAQTDSFGLPFYPVTAGTGYRLEVAGAEGFDAQQLAPTSHTTWSFTASTSSAVDRPFLCIGSLLGDQSPCGWLPLIYPQYQLPTALDDTAPAGRPFEFTIDAVTADPAGRPAIAGAHVWVSYDDGAHWVPAWVSGRHGSFQVRVTHPALARTTGAVSIRTEIWDTAGNRVVQQIDRAYGLVDPHRR